MRKVLFPAFILFLFILTGCGRQKQSAITIGNISFSAQEFEQAFKNSRYAIDQSNPARLTLNRKAFLEDFISTKLILKEAEAQGLNKDPQFLNAIQDYWERGLMKLMLAQKNKELASSVRPMPIGSS